MGCVYSKDWCPLIQERTKNVLRLLLSDATGMVIHAAPPWQSISHVRAVAALDGLRTDPSPLVGAGNSDLSLLSLRGGDVPTLMIKTL